MRLIDWKSAHATLLLGAAINQNSFRNISFFIFERICHKKILINHSWKFLKAAGANSTPPNTHSAALLIAIWPLQRRRVAS